MPEFLYIHIPFCIRKCIYCDFLSFSYDESSAEKYVNALCRELELKKENAGVLRTIYIGGGTPTVLSEESFRKLFKCLKDNFHLLPSAEITIEANPGTLNESKIDALLNLGVNRISLGVQSFDNAELKTLGRIHSSEEAIESIEMIRRAGLRNFSIDLMYGIPGQTIDTWKETLSKAVSFSPAHISSYELTPEKGTPLYEMIEAIPPHPPLGKGGQGGVIKMPEEELVLEMYGHAIDYLTGNGYEHYEISNFALPGFRCIHNLNYWDRGEYIGAGAGAHSFIKDFRSRNTDNLNRYIEDLSKGEIPEMESVEIKREDALKEFIFLGLRKIEGISILKAEELGLDILHASKELIEEGCLAVLNGYLRLTRKGIVISNEIIVRLFEKLELD